MPQGRPRKHLNTATKQRLYRESKSIAAEYNMHVAGLAHAVCCAVRHRGEKGDPLMQRLMDPDDRELLKKLAIEIMK